jgi:hypothetical protein
MAEAWVATFKNELVDGRRFPSFEHAEHEVLYWIGFYNAPAKTALCSSCDRRSHSSDGGTGVSPY